MPDVDLQIMLSVTMFRIWTCMYCYFSRATLYNWYSVSMFISCSVLNGFLSFLFYFHFRWLQQSYPLHEKRSGVHGLHQCIFYRCKHILPPNAFLPAFLSAIVHRYCYWHTLLDLWSWWRVCFAVTQGYRQKDYFIATQGPLPHTVEDFWRMVWEWKCHSIVMLTELQEREQVSCDSWWLQASYDWWLQ